jgi:hypothetical protein
MTSQRSIRTLVGIWLGWALASVLLLGMQAMLFSFDFWVA